MVPTSGAEQVLQTLAGFKAYAAGTLLVLELAGTFVFALSGAAAGVKHRLDLFGVLVVSCATATAGGITRDVLIGAVPPAALRDWRYLGISVVAGLVVFLSSPRPERQQRLRNLTLTFDAAGLALFAVSGTLSYLLLASLGIDDQVSLVGKPACAQACTPPRSAFTLVNP